ncbi:hypothetical protein pb186bvf_005322 [Paramecium bursaria]
MTDNYTQQYSDVFGCTHLTKVNYNEKQFCHQCGIYINNPSTRVFKTLKLKYNTFFDPIKILEHSLLSRTITSQFQYRQQVIEFLEQATERLRLSNNTLILAIQYLDEYFELQQVNDQQVFLYAATALMLAAKAQELDERIPFISKLKRYTSMTSHPEINSFKNEDFKAAERSIIQVLNWKLQQVTLLDRVEAILSFGVIDDDDSLGLQKENKQDDIKHQKLRDIPEQQILQIVKEIENKYTELVLQLIKENIYFNIDQSILALSCVAYLRKKSGLLNIWSQQLQNITNVPAQKISQTVSQIMTLMAKFTNRSSRNTTHHSYIEQYSSIGTPTAGVPPLTSFPYNTQPSRFIFENQKPVYLRSQPKIQPTLYTSGSQLAISKNDLRTDQIKMKNVKYTYLNYNENDKYEQQHKVGGNSSMIRTKIFQA